MSAQGGQVMCSKHNRMRLAKFCTATPVHDAEGNVVGTSHRCAPDNECNSGPGRGAPPPDAPTGEVSQAMRLYGDAGRGRYYDLAKSTGGIDQSVKKTCFGCGLTDHERPECPNQICRECHGVRERYGHQCPAPKLSAFVLLDEPTKEELADVRCPLCNNVGHLDCAGITNPPDWSSSCSYCGGKDHHGFECRYAPRDRWIHAQEYELRRELESRHYAPDQRRRKTDRSEDASWQEHPPQRRRDY